MTGRDYRSVAARIRQELPELDRVAHRASRAWASASRDSENLYVDAAALNIHGFYAGLERIFALIAERVDGSLPGGPNWRQDLLRQMTAEIPGTRPAVLTPDLVPALDRYRGFRHVVRNVYAYVLDPRLVAVLVEDLPETNERLRTQLAVFADALETIAEAVDD
ncbi:MAG: ribonuclease toxin HepT-like protein [Thermoleophilia bacterium]